MADDARESNGSEPATRETHSLTGGPTLDRDIIFGALLEHAPPLYVAGADGRLNVTNAAFDALAAANRALIEDELSEIFARLGAGEAEVVTFREYTFSGGKRHYRAVHFPLQEAEHPIGFGGTYTDMTAETLALRRTARTEARYQDVVRSTSDWVWEADANLNLTYASDRITDLLDLPPNALYGRYLFRLGEFDPGPHGAPTQPDLAAELAPFRGRIFLMQDASGRTRRIALSGVPMFDDASGKFTGYRGTGTDVTSQHEAELRARRSQRELEDSLREIRERNVQLDRALNEARLAVAAKTEFLGKMSHELRTPLNAIIGFAEMSVQQVFGSMNERYLNYFRDIRSAAHHLLHIINDILDAVNVDSSEMSISARPVSLREIVGEAKSIVTVRAEQNEIDIGGVMVSEDWNVMADPDRTRQILVNLLGNAVKFTDRGGRVGIEVARHLEGMVDVTIWDTGIGIPENELDRVFDSFHQVDAEIMTRPSEGTGLGLTISRQLAQLMGGDLTVESRLGQGSRFTVRLPLALQLAAVGE